jgi:hypothetical protein
MRPSKPNRKKTAFVPRIVFQAVAATGVVPACAIALAACGGATIDPGDAASDTVLFGVARVAFDGMPQGVALACFDGSGDPCRPPQPEGGVSEGGNDVQFTVAAACFDGGPYCPDAHFGVADVSFSDVVLGVALDAFGLDSGEGAGG